MDDVISRLMSGKEADVYVVRCGGEIRCAKVYKEASKRSFKRAVVYQEGRRSTQQPRCPRHGEGLQSTVAKQHEEVWQNTEVDALFQAGGGRGAGARPHQCLDGVLLMELITDADGSVAPVSTTWP